MNYNLQPGAVLKGRGWHDKRRIVLCQQSVLQAAETPPECISKPPKVKGLIPSNLQDVRLFKFFSTSQSS